MGYKTVVVPKDQKAQCALDYDEATPDQLLELVLNESEFRKLWEADFFECLNIIADVNIDDYEDEAIKEKEKLEKILASDIFTVIITDKMNEIKILFEEAVKRETGVYFYF